MKNPIRLGFLIEEPSTFHFKVYGLGGYHEMECLEHLILAIEPSYQPKLINQWHNKESPKRGFYPHT